MAIYTVGAAIKLDNEAPNMQIAVMPLTRPNRGHISYRVTG